MLLFIPATKYFGTLINTSQLKIQTSCKTTDSNQLAIANKLSSQYLTTLQQMIDQELESVR